MDARTALDRVQDYVSEADSFIETFDPEDWGEPDRFEDHGETEGLNVLEQLIVNAREVLRTYDHETQFELPEAIEDLRKLVQS